MQTAFYLASAVAIASAFMVITRRNAVHAVLYLIVSLLALAMVFYLLGAPFAAALEVIIYAGAIMVLFVFVIMILNLGQDAVEQERHWLIVRTWIGPTLLAMLLLAELVYLLLSSQPLFSRTAEVDARVVGIELFGPYLLAVEIASILLLAGLVGAYHVARQLKVSSAVEASAVEASAIEERSAK